MKRASYLDLLLAETRRAVQHNTPISILLLRLGERVAMVKEFGEPSVEATMRQIGQLLSANIRQNDLAFRYETTTIALVLGETGEKDGLVAAEKLKKLFSGITVFEKEGLLPFHAGLAEAVVKQQFDPVDIVTEVINRAEQALDSAVVHGPEKIVALAASLTAAAVA